MIRIPQTEHGSGGRVARERVVCTHTQYIYICTKSFTSLRGRENEAEKWFRSQQPDNSIVRYSPRSLIPFAREPALIIPVSPYNSRI